MNHKQKEPVAPAPVRRVAVVGVGHELRGDDSAGVHAACRLAHYESDHLLVIDAGPAPENFTAVLRRFAPGLVLLVDAAEMGELPGVVRWMPWQDASGLSGSTHTLPLSLLARYLQEQLGCQVFLIGIQPASDELGESLSPSVAAAVDGIVTGLRAVFAPRAFSIQDPLSL